MYFFRVAHYFIVLLLYPNSMFFSPRFVWERSSTVCAMSLKLKPVLDGEYSARWGWDNRGLRDSWWPILYPWVGSLVFPRRLWGSCTNPSLIFCDLQANLRLDGGTDDLMAVHQKWYIWHLYYLFYKSRKAHPKVLIDTYTLFILSFFNIF